VACLTRGRFDLDRMRTVIGREITLASEQSYRAVRITADMSWLLNEPCGFPLMLECEASFDETMGPSAAIMALCQLNRNYCPPDQLNELIHTHQLRVTANPEYDDGVLRIIRSLVPEGLQLIGELDAARHNPFMAALTSLGETNTAIHLDFTQVRFLDLGALSLLVTHAMRTPPDHILILDNLPPEVAGVIQTLGWHHLPGLTRGQPRRP
jgi:anti-anti-sigma regulatory factor